MSPGDWGFGTPWPDGYQDRPGWWRAAATRMAAEGAYPFTTMRLPLGTQRSPASRTGQSARAPEAWTAYLGDQVLPFWRAHGWLDRALVWGWDEPGPVYSRRYAAPQACAAHAAGVTYLTTGAPALRIPARRVTIPWGQGSRSFTIRRTATTTSSCGTARAATTWTSGQCSRGASTARSRRPSKHRSHIDVERELRPAIRTARARGASIWSFTYEALTHDLGSPGYAATEPATDARVFGLWNALEGTDGTLYADGMTSYDGVDPYRSLALHGQHVLLYPALKSADEPVSSLRLESIRDGIEDADLARLVVAQARPPGAARDPRARADLLDPRRPPAARLHVGLRSRDDDEVRVAALPPRRGHERRARAGARGAARGARARAAPGALPPAAEIPLSG